MRRRALLQAAGLALPNLALPNLALAGLTLTSLVAPGAGAQPADWPGRPVTLLVPFVPDGASDIVARALAPRLQERLGRPVVVENRPGGNGEIAGRLLAAAAPDGHSLMVGSVGVFAINAALRPDLAYDPVRDFAPVTLAVTTPNVLVVNPETLPVADLAELLDWLRAHPGRSQYATSGIGSSDHMTMELFKQRTGTDPAHAPFPGGGRATAELLAGRAALSFQNLGTVAGPVAAGRLRALLVTDDRRAAILPEVPTAAEAGLADFVVTSWQAVMGPAGLPMAQRARLNEAAVAALRHPDTRTRLQRQGFTVVASDPEACARFQEEEIDRWRQVIQAANLRAE